MSEALQKFKGAALDFDDFSVDPKELRQIIDLLEGKFCQLVHEGKKLGMPRMSLSLRKRCSQSSSRCYLTGMLDREGEAALKSALESLSSPRGKEDNRSPKQRRGGCPDRDRLPRHGSGQAAADATGCGRTSM